MTWEQFEILSLFAKKCFLYKINCKNILFLLFCRNGPKSMITTQEQTNALHSTYFGKIFYSINWPQNFNLFSHNIKIPNIFCITLKKGKWIKVYNAQFILRWPAELFILQLSQQILFARTKTKRISVLISCVLMPVMLEW